MTTRRRKKSGPVTSLIREYYLEILSHPPYSPDLSPIEYALFPKLKMPLRGVQFVDLEYFKVAVAMELRSISDGCLATGIADLPKKWNAVI